MFESLEAWFKEIMENDAVTNTGDNGGSRNPLVRPLDDSVDDEVQNLGRRDDSTSHSG